MYDYGIGLDIGISSVGWAVVALDGDENPCGILNMGVGMFDTPDKPAEGRRIQRGMRRSQRRRKHRKERIRNLIIAEGIMRAEEMEHLYEGQLADVYKLRKKALDERLDNGEFARVLIHLAQRRGFKSNRKKAGDKEEGITLKAVSENKSRLAAKGYRTVGEMFCLDEEMSKHRRNHAGEYIATVTRDMIEDEVKQIFEAQRRLGAEFAGEAVEEKYCRILLSQRSYDDGPAAPSQYREMSRNSIRNCEFEKQEKAAAKACFSFEYMRLLSELSSIRIIQRGEKERLSAEQREKIISKAKENDNITYRDIREMLNLSDESSFNMVNYSVNDYDVEKSEKKTKINNLKAYNSIRKCLKSASAVSVNALSAEQLDTIGRVLSEYSNVETIKTELKKVQIEDSAVEALLKLNFSGHGHLSVLACRKLIPFLEQGMVYSEACDAAGYNAPDSDGVPQFTLRKLNEEEKKRITSPVANRAISQSIIIINAIIREQGRSPMYVNVELARDIAKSKEARDKEERKNRKNRERNEADFARIKELMPGMTPSGHDLVKYRLYLEQQGKCMYSGKAISLDKLFEGGYYEVDHIVPYSISFDDSNANKVLVLTEENQKKGNKLPLQYLPEDKKPEYIQRVMSLVSNPEKRRRLLKEKFTEEDNGYSANSLTDTRTASRFMMNFIRENLLFAESAKKRKTRVMAVNGQVTANVRKRWNIKKIRADGDLHHAVDALVVACTTRWMVESISRAYQEKESRYTYNEAGKANYIPGVSKKSRIPYPWPRFEDELAARLSRDPVRAINDLKLKFYMDENAPKVKPVFVYRAPNRKVKGALHEDTVRSKAIIDEGKSVSRTPLTKLKLKNGEIENYYRENGDTKLYEALKQRLIEFDGVAEKAFAEPFYKPSKDMSKAPEVKKVKTVSDATIYVDVRNNTAVADPSKMVRIDVFYVQGEGYYVIPIYTFDVYKTELPNKAVVSQKPYSKWKEMREEDFCFSLYRNDLIKVYSKNEISFKKVNPNSSLPESYESKSELLYYRGFDRNTASMGCINHDNSYMKKGMGIKTLEKIEKYTVDVLGNYYPVRKEERQRFDVRRK